MGLIWRKFQRVISSYNLAFFPEETELSFYDSQNNCAVEKLIAWIYIQKTHQGLWLQQVTMLSFLEIS